MIIAVDVNQEKLQFAKNLGATHVVMYTNKEKTVEAVKRLTGGGVDYTVEASGIREVTEASFEALNDHGKLAIAGNIKKGEKISITPFDLIKGKQICGTWGGETRPDEDIPYYANEYLKGRLDVGVLITQRFRLEQVNEAMDVMAKNQTLGRMVIELT